MSNSKIKCNSNLGLDLGKKLNWETLFKYIYYFYEVLQNPLWHFKLLLYREMLRQESLREEMFEKQ